MAFKYRLSDLFVFLFGLACALRHKHFAPHRLPKKRIPLTRVLTERTDYCTVLLRSGLAAHVLHIAQERANGPTSAGTQSRI